MELADPADRRAARRTFVDLVAAHPTEEFALMRGASDESFIIRGRSDAIDAALTMATRLAALPSRGHIIIEARSRSVDSGLGFVREQRRLPAAEDADFAFVAATASRTRRPARGEIHFIDEHHRVAVTKFGVEPGRPAPFHIDVPLIRRRRVRRRFASLDGYRDWVISEFATQPTLFSADAGSALRG